MMAELETWREKKMMEPVNRTALKEWAVVCAALASGRQTILLRKGGIDEGPHGFQAEHPEFWLFPTRFHQRAEELTPDDAPLLNEIERTAPPPGAIRLDLYAVVKRVDFVEDDSRLPALDGLHILAPATLAERFAYRGPGLFVLTVRVYRRDEPFEISDAPHFAGCHSWVDLRNKLPTAGLSPALDEDRFREQSEIVRRRMHKL
jgi:hypothetical protein